MTIKELVEEIAYSNIELTIETIGFRFTGFFDLDHVHVDDDDVYLEFDNGSCINISDISKYQNNSVIIDNNDKKEYFIDNQNCRIRIKVQN